MVDRRGLSGRGWVESAVLVRAAAGLLLRGGEVRVKSRASLRATGASPS